MTSTTRDAVLPRTVSPPSPKRRSVLVFVAATAITGVAALVLGMWLAGNLTKSYIGPMSVGGTGDVTGWGLPASKLVMDLSSIGVIGMLLTCLLLPSNGRELSAPARRCLRTARWLALVWAVSNAALLMFSWSDVVARPVTALPVGKLFTDTAKTFPDAAAFMTSTALALVIAVAVYITETRRGVLLLLPLALYDLVPMTVVGHASHGALIKYSIVVHVIAMALWVGGLAALVIHVRREPALLAVAVPRFSTLALYCYIGVAVSGIVASWQLLGSVSAVWGSRFGVLVMLKAAALIALGIFGWWHRRHTLSRIRTGTSGRSRRAFLRLAAAEIVVMVAAVAIAVALSRAASPDTIRLHGNSAMATVVEHPVPRTSI